MPPPDEVVASRRVRPIAEIGRGGMAEVYLCLAEGPAGFKKLVVLKQAKRDLCDQQEFLDMFLDEARLAARLNHPNVVQTYEVGHEEGRYFIAMEYLDGQPFHRIRSRVGPRFFPLGMQIRIFIEVLAGLHHAHELTDFDGTPLGVVHRDATPQNVFVTYDGQIKLVDFGIAKASSASSQTHAGILKGKVAYMAPEQARGDRVDCRADLFAVGVMIWEAMTGERMWQGMDDLAVVGRLAQGRIPSLPEETAHADPELSRICRRALASLPADRHPTALDLAHDLERWLERRGEEVTARAVGRDVAAHFSEERAQMKTLIERSIRGLDRSAPAPTPSQPEREPTLVTLIEPSPPPVLPPPRRPPPPPPSRPAPPSVAQVHQEDIPETLRHSSVSMDALRERSAASRLVQRSRAPLTIASMLLLAGGLGAAMWMLEGSAPPPATTAATAPPSAPAVTEVPSAPAPAPPTISASPAAEIDVTVRVWPNTAHLFLDGLPLSTGWYKGKLPKDGRVHRIRAEAPSFVSKEQVITTNGEIVLNLALEPKSPANRPMVP